MRNTWKGFTIGALTGMLGGVVLDLAARTRARAGHLVDQAAQRAPAIAERIPDTASHVAHRTVEAVREADIPGVARDLAHKAQKAAGTS